MSSIILSFVTIILTIASSSMGLDFNRLCEGYSGTLNGIWIALLVLSILAFGFLCFSIYQGVKSGSMGKSALKRALGGGKHSNLLAFVSLSILFIVGCLGWNSANRCSELKKQEHIKKINSFNQFYVAITCLSLGGMGILFTRMHCKGGVGKGLMGKLEEGVQSATGGLQIPGL